ncbi:MAG: cupin domain-containing protein [Aliidongia sp.]
MIQPANLLAAFDDITEFWSPKVVGRVNDQYVKVAKLKGEIAWHKHDEEDELFHVVRGRLRIQFETQAETVLEAGEFLRRAARGCCTIPLADEEVLDCSDRDSDDEAYRRR